MNPLKFLSRGGAGVETDPDFENTVLLLHGDGNQGATNFSNTGPTKYMAFTDNSDNNFPITVNGDAYGDNFSPFARDEGYWSNAFDGTGDYLTVPYNSAFDVSTGDFTIEGWFYPTSASGDRAIASLYDGSGNIQWYIGYTNTSWGVYVYPVGTNLLISSATIPAINQWVHFALVRDGANFKFFVQGALIATVASQTLRSTTANLYLGTFSNGSGAFFLGNISNFRVVKGTAVYTSAFTPSTTPLTAISGTSLLTCQSNRFIDNSTNNFTITRNGDVAVSPFTPFTVTPNTTDGSGYFDGSGDNLQIANNAAFQLGSTYTIEGFFYTGQTTDSRYFGKFSSGVGGWLLIGDSAGLEYYYANNGATNLIVSTSVPMNAWNHIVIASNGTTLRMWLNGNSIGSVSSPTTPQDVATYLGIGTYNGSLGTDFNGYISNFRIVNGVDVYGVSNTTITVPTAPLTALSGTSLLTCQYQGTVRNVGFIDSSPYDHRITRVGNTTQGSFSPFSKPDGRWGNYFDGTGDYLTIADNSALDMGSSDMTIEAWVYVTTKNSSVFFAKGQGSGVWEYFFGYDGAGLAMFYGGGSSTSLTDTISLNTWTHVAMVRNGSSLTAYVNGSSVGSVTYSGTYTSTNDLGVGGAIPLIGSGYVMKGYISNARIVKSAVYTTTFTPPTAPLTAIANTSLLTCQSNRFIDNSTNNFTITRNGDVKVTPFSPFPITTAYDPAVNGGSGYFDGSGDYLAFGPTATIGTGQFTIEAWVYFTVSPSSRGLWGTDNANNGGFTIRVNSTTSIVLDVTGGGGTTFTVPTINTHEWTHIACVRDGSNNTTVFVNGKRATTGSLTVTTNFNYLAGLGLIFPTTQNPITGYIGSARIVKGSAVYDPTQTTCALPTGPLTAISGTQFLCNFTNAGIFDNTGFNNLETVGNAQIDTSVKKYGTGAMKFDGSGDVLKVPHNNELVLNTEDWTIEFWIYPLNTTRADVICKGDGGSYVPYMVLIDNGVINFNASNNGFQHAILLYSSSGAVATNAWTHVAVTKSGSTVRIFSNGTVVGTGSYSGGAMTNTLPLGVGGGSNAVNVLNGYMDDVRITKGIARYTSNFTPPTKAFADVGT